MKIRLLTAMLVLAGLALIIPQARADSHKGKPVVATVVVQDMDSMLETAEAWTSEFGDARAKMGLGFAKNMLKHSDLLKGIDTSRPMGMIVLAGEDKPEGMMALPVKDWDAVKATVKKYARSSEEVDDHVRKIVTPYKKTVYARHTDRWLLISESKGTLTGSLEGVKQAVKSIPKCDATVLVTIHMSNIPEECLEKVEEHWKKHAIRCAERHETGDKALDAMRRRISLAMADRMADALEEIDTVSMAFNLGGEPLRMSMHMKVVAKSGTPMASYFNKLGNAKSRLQNIITPEIKKQWIAGGALCGSLPELLEEREIEHIGKAWRKQAMAKVTKKLDGKSADLGEEVVDGMLKLVHKFLDKNTIDQCGVIACAPEGRPYMVGGRFVADGYLLEKNMGKMIEIMKAEMPECRKCAKCIKLETNVEEFKGFHIHKLTATPPPVCREYL